MPYGELLQVLEAEVRAQCRAVEEESRREVEGIQAEGRRLSAAAREEARARAAAEGESLRERARRRSERAVERAVLAEQHRLLGEVRTAAAAVLAARSTPALTCALLAEALADDDGSPLRATCDPGHAGACREWLRARDPALAARTTVLEAGAPRGGVEVAVGEGLVVENTLASRLERAWPALVPTIAPALLGGEP